jgi:hypothetical protein
MSTTPTTPSRFVPGSSLYGLYILAILACIVGNLFIRLSQRAGWLPDWAHVAVALASAAPLALAAGLFWRMLARDLDEMLQRIVLEGLAFAMIIFIPLAGLYVNLRSAGAWTPRLDAPDVLLGPAVLVAIGIAIAWGRYK